MFLAIDPRDIGLDHRYKAAGIQMPPLTWPVIGHEAARSGLDVIVFKTHKLLEKLAPDRFSGKRAQLLTKLCIDAGLLILDDFAFRPYSQLETELLYTLSDERLTEGSIIVTSNRPPKTGSLYFLIRSLAVPSWTGLFRAQSSSSSRRDAHIARKVDAAMMCR